MAAESSAFASQTANGASASASSEMKVLVSQLLNSGIGEARERREREKDASGDLNLATSDADFEQMVPIIKNVFRSGRQAAFVDELAAFAQAKQEEIERLCGYNYQEFVQAVDQLLKVRQAATDLKARIVELNDDRQASGKQLLQQKRELLKQRQNLENLDSTIAGLQKCLEVLRISNRMFAQVEARKYYSALRLMDDLENIHLPQMNQYEWAKHMKESLPGMRTKILEDVDEQVKSWFYNIRETHRKVGWLAMDSTVNRQRSRFEVLRRGRLGSAADISGRTGAYGTGGRPEQEVSYIRKSLSVEMALNEENEFNVVDNDRLRVDFVPLYQGVHIYNTLGRRDEFKKTYDENRKAQLNLVLTGSFNLTNRQQIGTFATYLQDIIGYFVVESVVSDTTEHVRTRAAVEVQWELAVEKILKIVGDSLLNCYDPELFLEIKVLVVAFIQTMETYNYPVSRLYELLLSLFNRYSDLLRLQAGERVQKILDDDDYTAMTVNDPEEFLNIQRAFYIPETQEDVVKGYPRTLPFSRGFPQTCVAIKHFITGFYKFTEGFPQQYGEMDDIFKKALEALLSRNVNGALLQRLKGNNLTQVVQIITNLTYYELACGEFERVVQEHRAEYRSGKVTIHAVNTFRDTHKQGEKRIFQIVNDKLDNFMELVDYEFEPAQGISKPSPWLQDMTGWLSMTINSTLTNLPPGIRSFVYLDIFDHLAGNFKRILLDSPVERINLAFVDSLDVDTRFLENVIATIGDANLVECTAELRQLINLAKSANPEEYLTPQTRAKSYPRAKPADVITLFEKLMPPAEPGSTNVNVNVFKRKDASETRRKAMENVIERLRKELRGEGTSGNKAIDKVAAIFHRKT